MAMKIEHYKDKCGNHLFTFRFFKYEFSFMLEKI